MKRPLLKILPGVAVVLLSPSCSKDDDNIAEDNSALVAEQVIGNQVFYLKVTNSSALSKMAIDGLGTEQGTKTLQFEDEDELTIKFKIEVQSMRSGTLPDGTWGFFTATFNVTAKGTYSSTDKAFRFPEEGWIIEATSDYWIFEGSDRNAVAEAFEKMQNEATAADAAKTYGVELLWGDQNLDLSTIHGYDDIPDMLAAAPRSANGSLTLSQDEDHKYCFIVFAKAGSRTVTIGETSLTQKCYIVPAGTKVTVEGYSEDKITVSGKLYYVKERESLTD